MADTDGVPVLGGLFKVVKAPFKLIGGVGEMGLGALEGSGSRFGCGLKNTWNSVWDVPEGALDSVKDIAEGGTSIFTGIHAGEEKNSSAKLFKKKEKPVKTEKTVTPPAAKKPAAPQAVVDKAPKAEEKPAAPQVVDDKAPKAEEKPAAPQVVVDEAPKAEEKPAAPQSVVDKAPKAEEKPAAPQAVVDEAPNAEEKPASPQAVVDKAPKAEELPVPPAVVLPANENSSDNGKILKTTLLIAGTIIGAIVLKKGLFKLFSKPKTVDLTGTSFYNILSKQKPLGTLHTSVKSNTIPSSDIARAIKDKPLKVKYGNVHKTIKPEPVPATAKQPPQVKPEDILNPKTQPKFVAKSAEDAAKAAEAAAKKAAEEAAKKAADEAAKKAAEEAAKKAADEAAKKAAEEAAKKAAEEAAKKAAEEAAKKAADEAAKKAAEETAKKAEKAALDKAIKEGTASMEQIKQYTNQSFAQINGFENKLSTIEAEIRKLEQMTGRTTEQETLLTTYKKTRTTIKGKITKIRKAAADIISGKSKKVVKRHSKTPSGSRVRRVQKETIDVDLTQETIEESITKIVRKEKEQASTMMNNLSIQARQDAASQEFAYVGGYSDFNETEWLKAWENYKTA